MRRANLVIVRAGDQSLHPSWLSGHEDRNWDLVVSYFGNDPDRFRGPDIVRIDEPGPKWPALHELLASHPTLLDGYDYVWLPDDDLKASGDSIDRLFDLLKLYDLEVAQPALSADSYFGHVTTLRNKLFKLRYTNYIEVMAPCLRSDVLRRAAPMFGSNLSGWGLDFFWPRVVSRPNGGVAIIDEVTVVHTRPVGGPNYAALRAGGISPWDELRRFCRNNGMDERPVMTTHRAVFRNGSVIEAERYPRLFALATILGYLPAIRRSPEWRRMVRRLAGLAYKAARNIPDRVAEHPMTRARRYPNTCSPAN